MEQKEEVLKDRVDFKLAIINGNHQIDGINRDGEMMIYCNDLSSNHIDHFLNYFSKNYLDDFYFQHYNFATDPNSIGMDLAEMGDIVIYNATSYPKNENKQIERLATFLMPDILTDKQKDSLETFKPIIKYFDHYCIISDIHRTDNYRTANRRDGTSLDILDWYMYRKDENENEIKRK